MELFIKYPNEVQEELLKELINKARNTEIGRKFNFSEIKNYRDFASRVPLHCYENYYEAIERSRQGETNIFWPTPIKWFAKSSGTTNAKSKFIPVSEDSLEDCHYAAGKDLLCMYLNNNPESQMFTGKSLRLGGSKEIYRENGTSFGDLSAIRRICELTRRIRFREHYHLFPKSHAPPIPYPKLVIDKAGNMRNRCRLPIDCR